MFMKLPAQKVALSAPPPLQATTTTATDNAPIFFFFPGRGLGGRCISGMLETLTTFFVCEREAGERALVSEMGTEGTGGREDPEMR